jgi:hypothetical protein
MFIEWFVECGIRKQNSGDRSQNTEEKTNIEHSTLNIEHPINISMLSVNRVNA